VLKDGNKPDDRTTWELRVAALTKDWPFHDLEHGKPWIYQIEDYKVKVTYSMGCELCWDVTLNAGKQHLAVACLCLTQVNIAREVAGLDWIEVLDGYLALFSMRDRARLSALTRLEKLEADHDQLKVKYNESCKEVQKLQEELASISSRMTHNCRRGTSGRGFGRGGRGAAGGF
jgi:hypothetical protein